MLRVSLVSLVALTIAACAAQTGSATSESALVASDLADSATVLPGSLVFPRAAVSSELRARIESGARPIMMGGRGSDAIDASGQIKADAKNPYGFARRALAIHDDGLTTTITTEPVALDEAFQSLGAPTAGIQPTAQHTAQVTVPVIDLSNVQLWSNGGASLKLKTGSLSLGAGVDVGTDIDWYKLGQAHVIVNTSLDTELVLEADLDGPTSVSVSHDVYSGSWPIGSIGPVPITLGLVATIKCDIEADGVASATAGIRVSAGMKGGVQYDDHSGKSPVTAQPTFSAAIVDPSFSFTSGSTNTTCHIRPQFSVLLFDAAGPTLTPDLAANFKGQTPPFEGTVTGELGLDVGGKLEVFGKDLGSVDYHLFTVDKQLWSTQ